jgi:membrane fusion protein, copper/silver efflux system
MLNNRGFGARGIAIVLLCLGALVVGTVAIWAQQRAAPPDSSPQKQAGTDTSMPGMDMSKGMDPSKTPPAATTAIGTVAGNAPLTLALTVQQRIGVTLGKVEKSPLEMSIRTVGIVRPDETKLAHIHLRTEGWVRELFVSFTGQKVRAGDPLLSIYSPTFFSTEKDLLSAVDRAKSSALADSSNVEAARSRLELFGVPRDEIETLERTGKTATTLTLRSPIAGTVLEKKTFAGQYVMPQDELYSVADLSTVWVQAKVYEYELPHVQVGMPTTLTLSAYPDQEFTGKVVFIDPTVEEPARTVQVRIELSNKEGQFKPGMFAHVTMRHAMGEGLTVPTSAVIRTGERDLVYLAESEGKFIPVEVKISPVRFEDRFQVLKGLQAGETVVTSANFLIDSESRLRAGGGNMAGMAGMEGMDVGPSNAAGNKTLLQSKPKPEETMPGMKMEGDAGGHAGHSTKPK